MIDRDRELHEMADEGRTLMSDYIKREDAMRSIIAHDPLKDLGDSRGYAKWLLNKAPSADVAPVRHGRWITEPYRDNFIICRCSECMTASAVTSADTKSRFNYCPNCGARMDGEDNE